MIKYCCWIYLYIYFCYQINCPNCERTLAASRFAPHQLKCKLKKKKFSISLALIRFAPHLEKCMGMGRNSSRVASRRLATKESSYRWHFTFSMLLPFLLKKTYLSYQTNYNLAFPGINKVFFPQRGWSRRGGGWRRRLGGAQQAGRAKKERQKFSKEVLTLLKIVVDIHSVLNNKHVQLSIVYMRNLLISTCTLLESYRYISDKRVALSSRVVTHRYKWLVWPVCRFCSAWMIYFRMVR